MSIRYGHTSIVAQDWRRLAEFYASVFGCEMVPPERALDAAWLGEGVGVPGAALSGVHLRLPGCGPDGPTLEIFQYAQGLPPAPRVANRAGYGHIAFMVDDVAAALAAVCAAGGSAAGRVATGEVPGKGSLTFVYAADPEGNLIELQRWG